MIIEELLESEIVKKFNKFLSANKIRYYELVNPNRIEGFKYFIEDEYFLNKYTQDYVNHFSRMSDITIKQWEKVILDKDTDNYISTMYVSNSEKSRKEYLPLFIMAYLYFKGRVTFSIEEMRLNDTNSDDKYGLFHIDLPLKSNEMVIFKDGIFYFYHPLFKKNIVKKWEK